MIMKIWITAFLMLVVSFGVAGVATAQEDSKLPPTDEEQQKKKAEEEKKAFILLEQVVDEAQLLKLLENAMRDVPARCSRWPQTAWPSCCEAQQKPLSTTGETLIRSELQLNFVRNWC